MRRAALTVSSICAAALCLQGVTGQAATSAAPEVIGTVSRASPISADQGRVLWSEFDPARHVYHLVVWSEGRLGELPVKARAVPFDATLGTDGAGALVAVYSRCQREPPAHGEGVPAMFYGRGCDLYEYSFATRHERRLALVSKPGADEVLPSIWDGEIAFVRTSDRGGRASVLPHIYLFRRGRTYQVPNTPVADVAPDLNGQWTRISAYGAAPGPISVQLRNGRLTYLWTFPPKRACSAPVEQPERSTEKASVVWTGAPASGKGTVIDRNCDAGASAILGATQGAGYVADIFQERSQNTHLRLFSSGASHYRELETAGSASAIASDQDVVYTALAYDRTIHITRVR